MREEKGKRGEEEAAPHPAWVASPIGSAIPEIGMIFQWSYL